MSKDFSFAERIKQDLALLLVKDDFLLDITRIQKKYEEFFKVYDRSTEGEPRFYEKEWDDLNRDVETIRAKYNLSEAYEFAIKIYIQSGDLSNEIRDHFWHLNPYTKIQGSDKHCVTLRIYPETTLDDIIKNWPRIKEAKDKLAVSPGRMNRINNLQRDIAIYDLRKKGKTYKQIASIINEQRKKGTKMLGYEDIPKIVERLKKRANNLMAPKKS